MKKIISIIIITVMLISCLAIPYASMATFTELSGTGIINTESSNLIMRSGPGTDYEKLDSIPKGTFVTVLGKDQDSDEADWYKITYSGKNGYVMAKYVKFIENSTIAKDSDFETQIKDFPESYKTELRKLHAVHPTWVFTPLKTNISWATLMEKQCQIGRNLIQSPVAWKSYEKGAYNWNDGTWYEFDSGAWVQACNEAIGYYLDPRNFLDSNVYQFLVLSDDGSTVSADAIDGMLSGTFMHSSKGVKEDNLTYAEMIIKAAKEAGASPFLLAARIRLEQGSVGNKLAHGTVSGYEGYYNHFDIGAYAHDGRSAITNGAIYAKNKGWNSIYKSLLGGAQFLVKSYIAVGQNTLYLQKYDVVDGGNGFYAHQYMTNIRAAVDECATLRSGITGTSAEESALTFLIPVYDNMPETPQGKPATAGSANNILSSLSVSGYSFTVPFDKYTQEYEMTSASLSINVSATAYDSDAQITGTGTHKLKIGTNQIDVTVTATNGNKRTYTIYIMYNAPDLPNGEATQKQFTTPYVDNGTSVSGVPQQTTVSAFSASVTLKGYTMEITNGSGTVKSDADYVATGDRIRLYSDSQLAKTRYIVVTGDVNGDGAINVIDLLMIQKNILKISTISGEARISAADMNRDGNINVIDLLMCQKRILRIT